MLEMHRWSPNCSWIIGISCSCRMFWDHSLFMTVFLSRIVREPTSFSGQTISRCPTVGRKNVFALVFCFQSLYFLQNFSLSLMFFLERSGYLLPLLTPGLCLKVFASLCVQMHSHPPAANNNQVLHWWWHDSVVDFLGGDCPVTCWTLLGRPESFFSAVEPLSLEVLNDPLNGSFRCNILCSSFLASEALLMQSDDGYTSLTFFWGNFCLSKNTMIGSTSCFLL